MLRNEEKLELFKQAILEKANAQSVEIEKETAAQKKREMDREESRLLDGFYQETQAKVKKIKAQYTRELSSVRGTLKKELYGQREQYLGEIMARVRAELSAFAQRSAYREFLIGKTRKICAQWPGKGEIHVRPADLELARQVLAPFQRPVIGDEGIQLGGAVLYDLENGIVIDESLDGQLKNQKDWFRQNSGFQVEGGC